MEGDARTTAGKRRQTDVGKLVHQIQGDLDWIVMKCLEKDRTRRYDTAIGLAMDIQRHIDDEAVLARPPSPAYRFQKLVRRNKLAWGAAGAVACALLLGVVVSTWQAVRATNAETVAEDALTTVRRNAYAAEITVAFQAFAENSLERALELLDRQKRTCAASSGATSGSFAGPTPR
jgi:hypothetical protein